MSRKQREYARNGTHGRVANRILLSVFCERREHSVNGSAIDASTADNHGRARAKAVQIEQIALNKHYSRSANQAEPLRQGAVLALRLAEAKLDLEGLVSRPAAGV